MKTQREVGTQNRRRFTVNDYHRMAEAGIVEMCPIGGQRAVRKGDQLAPEQTGG